MTPAKKFHPVFRTWHIVYVWRGQKRFEREDIVAPLGFRRCFQRQSNGIEPLQHLQFVDDLGSRRQVDSLTEPSILAHGIDFHECFASAGMRLPYSLELKRGQTAPAALLSVEPAWFRNVDPFHPTSQTTCVRDLRIPELCCTIVTKLPDRHLHNAYAFSVSPILSEALPVNVVLEFYRTRSVDDAHAVIGRETAEASDIEHAMRLAQHLWRTLDMLQQPDAVSISDIDGNTIYSGAFGAAGAK